MTDKSELALFSMSFDQSQMQAVHQWIERFRWDPEDAKEIKGLINDSLERARLAAEAAGKVAGTGGRGRRARVEEADDSHSPEQRSMAPIGVCGCGGLIAGEPLPKCESTKTGRVFYKECSSCAYYSELFKIGNTFKEIEGG